jgi:hypothetical protein
VDACGRVLSCQTLNVAASRGPDSSGAYLILKTPRAATGSPGTSRAREMRRTRLTSGEILSAHGYQAGVSAGADYTRV